MSTSLDSTHPFPVHRAVSDAGGRSRASRGYSLLELLVTLAIVSVSPEIRYPERPNADQGGHLILLHGRGNGGVWFHNPSGIAPWQADAWLPYETVARFHARRGMALTRPR